MSTPTKPEFTNEEDPTATNPAFQPDPEQNKDNKDEPEMTPDCMPPGCGNG